MIDQATINEIYSRADIVDVVSDYITLKKRGVNYIGLCPFHNEKTPSFTVSPAKNFCKCFGCGKGGNPVNFIMEVENLKYYDALRFLAKKYNITIEEKAETAEEIQQRNERESLMVLTDWIGKHFIKNLETEEGKAICKSYFTNRGFTENSIKKFQLGYAIDKRDEYTQAALKEGFKQEYLEKTGLTIVKEHNLLLDRFKGRAIFPIHSLSGKIIAFGGRAIKKDEQVKYQNSPESEVYHKSQALYGVYFAKNAILKEKKCYIVEGYADVISMVQAGVENIVAPCGTALTTDQIRLLRRIIPSIDNDREEDNRNVTMLYDGDSAGVHAALKNGKLMLEEGLNVKVVVLPPEHDPDTFAQSHNGSDVIEYLQKNETDYVLFKTTYLMNEAGSDPIRKAQAISDVASTIAVIPSLIKRSVYTKECAKILDTDEKVIYAQIDKVLKKKAEADNTKDFRKRNENGQNKEEGNLASNIENKQESLNNPEAQAQNNDALQATATIAHKSPFFKEEQNIMSFVVKFGEHILCELEEENEQENANESQEQNIKTLSVVEYIDKSLSEDDLDFQEPKFKQMFEEAKDQIKKRNNLEMQKYFMQHHDPEISRMATDLIAEPYQLSKIHGEVKEDDPNTLFEQVPHVVLDLKFKILSKKIDEGKEKLRTAKDEEETLSIMTELKKLQDARAKLASQNGEKVYIGVR